MFCRHCGKEVAEQAVVCVNCGCEPTAGLNFCQNCGSETNPSAEVCVKCGVKLAHRTVSTEVAKSRLAAGLLGVFLGWLGIHNFYLGFNGKGVAQLLLGVVVGGLTCGVGTTVAWIWGLVEGILILTGSISTDAKGVPLKE